MVDISIVNGVYKPTFNWGAQPCIAYSLGKFHHDLTVLPHWKSWFRYRGIIPFYGRKIQVSELL